MERRSPFCSSTEDLLTFNRCLLFLSLLLLMRIELLTLEDLARPRHTEEP